MKSISLLLCFIPFLSFSQNTKFAPINDLVKDSTLVEFVNELKEAVFNKDVKFITAQLDKEVIAGFDGNDGIKAFVETWGLLQDTTIFWDYIGRALEIGGAYVNDPNDESGRYQVVFPYVYNFEPGLDDDYYALGVIVGKNVNLREQPDTKAKVVAQLTYDVVWYLYANENDNGETRSGTTATGDPEWYKIETYDHKYRGWVYWKYVYSTIGPRLFLFKNQSGKWKISSFVDGD